ncbi:uncharacterized protein LOC112085221 [Eutrema salsugineum]|uniref:uncharacterized protein LOC112085221 n=1 Tax=Eutrema salsugineum TaxID=72664 RepID=UPI000CED410B|nr:uncharacterized protein LOC112085221 [Eutrema salsugineum]
MKIFHGVEWDPKDDLEYEFPKSLMQNLFEEYEDVLMGNEEDIITDEVIEANKLKKKMSMQLSFDNYVEGNKLATREGKFGRKVTKKEASAKITINRLKNTVKKRH